MMWSIIGQNMDATKLEQFIKDNHYPQFRMQQIMQAVYHRGIDSFGAIHNIPQEMRVQLARTIAIVPFDVVQVRVSCAGDAMKALLRLTDGYIIETVLIAPKPGKWSACISSQVGCAMACAFCATGKQGIKRNLSIDEITSQVLFWRQYIQKEHVSGTFHNIVYMGMGEPLMNWDNVAKSIAILTDEKLFNFPKRGLSVSTSGVVPGIMAFADACPQINLAISLHFASDEKRTQYMPVNRRYNLTELTKALRYYLAYNNRKIFIEYIMLDGINDTQEDAALLVRFLRGVGDTRLLHVNLIRYNSIGEGFQPSDKKTVKDFQKTLQQSAIMCTIRKSVGDDIHGACGQLAGIQKPQS